MATSVAALAVLRERATLQRIHPDLSSAAPRLPRFDTEPIERFPYGARSEAAIFVGDLLCAEVPALARPDGDLEIVAVARRPGVLSKVAIRPRRRIVNARWQDADSVDRSASGEAHSSVARVGADHLARVSAHLDGERIQIVRWQASASDYITDALGLGEVPPMILLPWLRHTRVLLGEIDLRGIAGWRGLNTILASALTGWRIRLEPIAETPAWARLRAAMLARRPLVGTVVGPRQRGLRLEVLGLYATLRTAQHSYKVGQEVEVRITRMDADEGRIFLSDRLGARGQLALF